MEVIEFLLKYLNIENSRRQFDLFAQHLRMMEMITKKFPRFVEDCDELEKCLAPMISSSTESSVAIVNFILQHAPMEKLLAKWKSSDSLLHLVCEANDTPQIDFLLKHFNFNQLNILSRQLNGRGNIVKDLLNEENKEIFGNCF